MRVKIQLDDGKVLISVPRQYLVYEAVTEAIGDAEWEIAAEMEAEMEARDEKKKETIEKIQKLLNDLRVAENMIAGEERGVKWVRELWEAEIEKRIAEVSP